MAAKKEEKKPAKGGKKAEAAKPAKDDKKTMKKAEPKAAKPKDDSKLNKVDLVRAVAKATEYTHESVNLCITKLVETIQGALVDGKEVTITGFGTWRVTMVKGGERKNPMKPTETMVLADNNVVRFTAGMPFKRAVNGLAPLAEGEGEGEGE